ncbi:cytochrome P450 [Mycolicibacterium thermoresistibile]
MWYPYPTLPDTNAGEASMSTENDKRSDYWSTFQFDHHDAKISYAPHDVWRRLRNECPVIHSDRYDGFWFVSRYDDVKTVLSDWNTFTATKGTVLPEMFIPMLPGSSDPPLQKRYRTLINLPLAPQQVMLHEPWIREVAREWLEPLTGRATFDACSEFAEPYAKRVSMRVIGYDLADLDKLDHWTEVLSAGVRSDEESAQVGAEFFGYLSEVIEQRSSEPPREDIISAIVHGSVDGRPVTDDEKRGLLLQVTFGGLHTTGATIAGALLWLAGHPEDRARLLNEPELMPRAVEEFVRYVTPVPYSVRSTTTATELSGCPIPKDEWVMFGLGPANYDPQVFDNADDVVLDRFPNRHFGFGAGAHRCPGAHLARIAVQVGIEEFLRTFSDFTVADYYGLRYTKGEGRALTALPIAVNRD